MDGLKISDHWGHGALVVTYEVGGVDWYYEVRCCARCQMYWRSKRTGVMPVPPAPAPGG